MRGSSFERRPAIVPELGRRFDGQGVVGAQHRPMFSRVAALESSGSAGPQCGGAISRIDCLCTRRGHPMEELQVAFEPYADQTQKDIVVNGVDYHNIAATGHAAYYPVGFYLRNGRAEVLGGSSARSGAAGCTSRDSGVAEPARGAGNATRLVQAAERYAIERGCHGAFLGSFSFQARPLYEKLRL